MLVLEERNVAAFRGFIGDVGSNKNFERRQACPSRLINNIGY